MRAGLLRAYGRWMWWIVLVALLLGALLWSRSLLHRLEAYAFLLAAPQDCRDQQPAAVMISSAQPHLNSTPSTSSTPSTPSTTPLLSVPSSTSTPSTARACNDAGASLTSMWKTWQRCWTQGRWERLNDTEITYRSAHRYYTGVVKMVDMDNYTWVIPHKVEDDDDCACFPYHEFDKKDFCGLIDGRDVFLIGDSLSGQFRESLLNLAGERPPGVSRASIPGRYPYRRPIYSEIKLCNVSRPATLHLLLNWARGNLKLASDLDFKRISQICHKPDGTPRTKPGGQRACQHVDVSLVAGSEDDRILGIDEFSEWARKLGIKPGVIVVNSGAHYRPDEVFIPETRKALRWLVAAHPEAIIIWRNTAVGHVNCSAITAPLAAPQDLRTLPYNWDKFPTQNALVAELIEKEFPTVIYMDVANMTQYRGDLHSLQFLAKGDCLHYHGFAPSPVDHWVIVLYNVLRAFREWKQAQPPE